MVSKKRINGGRGEENSNFVELKYEDRKPDKNSSLRRLQFMTKETSTKNAVQEFHLRNVQ
jgi:hypothetical protein